MTNVKCVREDGKYIIDIVGHAGYNPGMDIVCGAASVLGYTLCNALMDVNMKSGNVNTYEDGEIHITIEPEEDYEEKVNIIIETIMLGYTLLEDQYPDYMSVEIE